MDVRAIHDEATMAARQTAVAMITAGKENNYCGSAWAVVHPATGSSIREMMRRGIAQKGDTKGATISVRLEIDTQSLDIREAAIQAYCDVLRRYGIPASMRSRAT